MKQSLFLLFLSLLVSTSIFSINPMREYKLRPEAYQLEYEEVKIATQDRTLLNAWVMTPSLETQQDYTFILAGSDAGNMGFLLAYAFYLVREGITVITFDYRGFGESSDFNYNPDFLYHTEYIEDLVTVIDWTKTERKPKKIGVMAFSMGTLVATAAYGESKFDALVAEGFILSPDLNVKRLQELKGKKLLLPEDQSGHRLKINKIDIPVLLFAGTLDQNTTLADSQRFAAGHDNRKVISFEGDHLKGASIIGLPAYIEAVKSILE